MNLIVLIKHDYTRITIERGHLRSDAETTRYVDRRSFRAALLDKYVIKSKIFISDKILKY
jgi:hypothetical protein